MKALTTLSSIKLTMKKFSLLLLATALMSVANLRNANATHSAGADLTYRCLGGLQYEIEATFYRDCGGIAEPSTLTVNYSSASGGYNLSITLNKIPGTGQEITVPCQTSASTCNGGASTGIRKFVYRGTVTLPSARTDWVFSYSVCCRNCTITTIQNPCANSTLLYVESKLNNVAASCNSSPTFSNIPIAFVCIGQNFNYNHGVLDADGDSISYQLITPKISATTNVTYISPNNTNNPVQSSTPFTVNALTGDINFTPTQQQIGILAILVKEYRNGVLIGSVIRDMQVYTVPCTNSLPTASGINGSSNYSMNVCPLQQVCFDILTNDADAAQLVTQTNNVALSIPSATLTVTSGPHPTLHFCWTPTLADIGSLPNTFTVTVRDNACPTNGIQTFSYTLYVPGPNFNLSSTNVTCNGANNGTATATPVAGSGFSYAWNTNPVQNSATASGLAPGTYTCTVTDATGCSVSKTVTITQPAAIGVVPRITDVTCVGQCNGSINNGIAGGTAPFTYGWSNGQTTEDINGLCAGTYTCTITDANNCTLTVNPVIGTTSNMSGSIVPTNILCNGNTTGAADLTIGGGTGTYQYLWSNGTTNQDLTGVGAGSYTVTITDGSLCTKSYSVTLTQPAAAINASQAVTNVNCYGQTTGAITLSMSGGTPPYSYLWNTGATSQNLSNLAAGTYTVTITDANGCTSLKPSMSVTQPIAALNSTSAVTNLSCYNNSTGSINITVTGGTAPYSYIWSNGNTSEDLSGIAAGIYTVTITDNNGCTSANSSISVTQPAAALNFTVAPANVNCYGNTTGSVNITVTGGTAPYTYLWSNGATSEDISNVGAGSYSVTVTDANGCTMSNNSITLSQPSAALGASHAITPVNCYGNATGSINMTVSGGTGPYTYLWNTGGSVEDLSNVTAGTYSVTVTDANGCTSVTSSMQITQPSASLNMTNSISNVNCFGNNSGSINITITGGTTPYGYLWNTGATVQDLTNAAAGVYTVTVTDANGCTSGSGSMTISQPAAALNANVAGTQNINCYGNATGSINVNVNGGTAPYSFLWNTSTTSQNLNNIIAGTYSVTVTDANNCTSAIASITISQPAASLSSTIGSTQNVSCNGGGNGSLNLTVAGGTSPYSFNWSNSATTQNLNNLSSGTYTVTITDANGCTTSNSAAVTQPASSLSSSISSFQNVNCFGGNNASVAVTASGGTSPYIYSWSNGANTSSISNIAAGIYTVTVTDANGCTSSQSKTITQPSASLAASVTGTQNVSCFGLSNGSVTLNTAGGTTPYSYNWSNGATTQSISNVTAGTYSVTVTDANGCTTSVNSILVSQPAAALAASVNNTQNVNCFGNATGSINLSVNGGTSPYNYSWSNGASSQNISNLSAGSYSVTITDANGCTSAVNAIAISQPGASLSSSVNALQNVSCFGGSNAAIDLTISGGTTPYSYSWSNGSATQDLNGLTAGIYTVTITDANGCTIQQPAITISQPAASLALSTSPSNVNCFGNSTGSITSSTTGGTSPYSYSWSNGATSANLSNITAGNYALTVTDANGCTASSASITISQPSAALAASSSVTNVLCHGNSSGAINLSVTGGTAPYAYSWSNGSTSQNISGVASGYYTVTITDANGCTSSQQSIQVNEPSVVLNAQTGSITNVGCNGGTTGAINLNVNGGTAPYSYNWSNGSVSQNITGLAAGSYTVTVTDANGCTKLLSAIAVSQPGNALSTSVITSQNVSCSGGGNGSINLTVTGGTAPYSYNWSNGATSQNISGLYAGTYGVSVTDANGCTIAATGTVSQPAGALSSSISSSENVLCFGGNNGTATLQVSGGTPPYAFLWSNGSTSQNLSSLSAGNYSVTITDDHGCISQSSVVITQPSATLAASLTASQNVLCNGGNSGSIDVTVAGGTSPYSYTWSNGAITQDLTGLNSGTYTLSVTDANNCQYTLAGITINQPASPLAASNAISNVNCFGNNTGSIDLTVSGGTSPYSYNWSNGANSQDLNGVIAGNYSVVVADANGCTIANSAITVSQPSAALTSSYTSSNVNCFANASGSISLNVTGGTTPYSFNWSNGSTSQNLSNISSGIYTVSITDANGCTSGVANISISQPSAALSLNNAITNVGCFGGNTGSVDITVNGGTIPYSYTWSNGSTSEDISNVASGTYTVTVTDANGCTVQNATLTVTQPSAALTSSIGAVQNVNCFGNATGSISVSVSGGTTPYSYVWNNGAVTQNLNNIVAGTYSVTITDANGCNSQNANITITQPSAALSTSVTGTQNVSCNSGGNGSIDLTVTGGTQPYSFVWSNGSTTEDINGLYAGSYNVAITDANGCIASASATVTQPAGALASSISSSTNILCNGGNNGVVNLAVVGGTAPYNFVWSNGATSQNLNNVIAGTYSVTVTDANNCISNSSVILTEPNAALTASPASTQNVSCFGIGDGAINLTVTGGTPPYTFGWNNGATTQNIANLPAGTYSVGVMDANGCEVLVSAITITQPAAPLASTIGAMQNVNCFGNSTGSINLNVTGGTSPYSYNWSNGSTSQNISNLAAGTYSVTITDANNCTAVLSGIVISQPSASLAGSVTATQNVSCTGGGNGSIDLTVTGGTSPYSYNWSNGASTEDLSGLGTGSYTVTITDVNGCTTTVTETITQPASSLASGINASGNVNCNGGNNGSIDLNVTGGTTPYSFNWSNGATTEDISGLTAGSYTVTVTDDNGCTSSSTVNITQPSAALSSAVTSSQNILCFGGTNGSIDLTTAGGTSPYAYNWSNGASTEDLSALPSGTYNVIVTDANGCTTVNSITLIQPSASLAASVSASQNVFCFGGNNGYVNLNINGGTAPYNYQWSNGANTQNLSNLVAGNYSVTVTDANNCTATTGIIITEPANPLNASVTNAININCFGGNSGSIDLTVSGGTQPYIYNWSNGASTEDLSGLNAGIYTVTVTDVNGCTYSSNATLTEPSAALSSVTNVLQNVSCFGGNNGSIDLTVSGGTAPYSYIWSNGSTTEDISNLAIGSYSVTITDANGCSAVGAASITQPVNALNGTVAQIAAVACFGGTNGALDLTVIGGSAPYTYNWSNGFITEDISGVAAGIYTVTITDANGCTYIATGTITQPASPVTPTVAALVNVDCFANNNGSITLNVTGGTPPYLFYWSNGANTQNISNLPQGGYWVTVIDSNGCFAQLTAVIHAPEGAVFDFPTVTNVNCTALNTGSIILGPTGGTPPYTFVWSNGATTENLLNVTAGIYYVTITDSLGCIHTDSVTVGGPTTLLAASAGVSNVGCAGNSTGQIILTVNGGITPYSFQWNNGATTQNLSNIPAGIYTVTVSDSYGCTQVLTNTVTEPSGGLTDSLAVSQVTCFGLNNGSINLGVFGGTPVYTFLWSNGASTQNISNLSPGTYSVTITDANGCSKTESVTINQPANALAVTGSADNSNCLNGVGGNVTISPAGGTAPYSFLWSNNATTQNLSTVGAGVYTVTVTDDNGCTTNYTNTINDLSVLSLNADATEFCMGGLSTLSTQQINGATYQWYQNNNLLNGAINNTFITPVAGIYTVTVTNSCGTFTSNPIEVKVHSVGNISVSPNSIICPKLGEFATLSAYGGGTYRWDPGFGLSDSTIANPVATPTSTTKYTVTVTTSEGCVASAEVLVSVVCDTLFVPTGYSPNGNGINDTYEIDGLDKYPGNKIFIYNRWGNLVFKMKDYDNSWNGTSNVSGIYLGKQLPNGTYYFILDLNNGSKPMQGYITLKR